MEDQEKVEPDYLKGFNEGYLMALYMPEVASQFAMAEVDDHRGAGFKAGLDQFIMEKDLNIRLPKMTQLYTKGSSIPAKEEDHEKDNGIEPEME